MEKDYYKKYLKYKLKYNKLSGGKILGIEEKEPLIYNETKIIDKIKLISLKSNDIIKEFDKIKTFGEFFNKYNEEYKDKIQYYQEDFKYYKRNFLGKYKIQQEKTNFNKNDPFKQLLYNDLSKDKYEETYKKLYHDDETQKQIIIDNKINQKDIKEELDKQFITAYKNDKNDYTLYKKDTTLYKLFLNQKLNGDKDYIIFDRYSTLFNLSSYGIMNDINMFYNYKTKNRKIAGYFNYYTFNTPSPYYYTTQLDEEKQIFNTYIQELYLEKEQYEGDMLNLEIMNTEDLTIIIKNILNNIFNLKHFIEKNFTFFLKFLFVEPQNNEDLKIKNDYKIYFNDEDIKLLFKLFNKETATLRKKVIFDTTENNSLLNKLLINITNLFIEKVLNNYNEHLLIINNLILQFINNKIHIKEILTFENIEEILNILREILETPEKYDIELDNLYSNIYYHISQIFNINYNPYVSDKFIILIYNLLDNIKIKIRDLLFKNIFKELFCINYIYYILHHEYFPKFKDEFNISVIKDNINKNSNKFKIDDKDKIIKNITFYKENIQLKIKNIIYYKYTKYLFYSYLIFLIENNLYKMINPNSLIVNKDIFKYCFHTQIKIPRNHFDEIIYFNGTDKSKIKIINIFIDPTKTSLYEDIEDYKNFYINKPYINLYWLNDSDEVKKFKNIIRDIRNFCTINFEALNLLYNDENVICSHNLIIGPENFDNTYFNFVNSFYKIII